MTDRLDPHEIYLDDETQTLSYKERCVVQRASSHVESMIFHLERIGRELPTLPEKTDVDDALRSLRHLRKQLEGSST